MMMTMTTAEMLLPGAAVSPRSACSKALLPANKKASRSQANSRSIAASFSSRSIRRRTGSSPKCWSTIRPVRSQKVEAIMKGEDLAAAQSQSEAMAKAKISLREAVEKALGESAGYRALGAVPNLKDGRAVASVLLLKGEEFKIVNQALE